ncbi:hypothetical protein MNB_SV-6-1881 [hydrothermal vent metagenome]|uniref:Polymerase nucleotidyl transferase domain-containing protein n=1 Tax=hydrothermal vent metagenome TaxID=652676 RepID=A0A1W1C4R8_9ZZZZ
MQEPKLKLLQQAKKHYVNEGFNIVGFFGSYARGEETAQSDIDFLTRSNFPSMNAY